MSGAFPNLILCAFPDTIYTDEASARLSGSQLHPYVAFPASAKAGVEVGRVAAERKPPD